MTFHKEILDHGFVELQDWMPRTRKNVERVIVESARISIGNDTVTDVLTKADKRLIERLYKDQHTSPFEMIELRFVVNAPLFVARQWFRHRTGSYNEQSARYSVIPDMFYIPANVRSQHKTNKQMSGDEVLPAEVSERFSQYLSNSVSSYGEYEQLCKDGVARELARIGLPQNIYTRFYYKTDLHNFLNFAMLRMAPDAQFEIREYANAMFDMVKQICPNTCSAFLKYKFNAVKLNADQIQQLYDLVKDDPAKSTKLAEILA